MFNVPCWQNEQNDNKKSAKTPAKLEDIQDSVLVKKPVHFNRVRSKSQAFDITS